MEKVYFTFGSAPQFPFERDEYIVVLGTDWADCTATFRKQYPDRTEGVLNCSDRYSESEWSKTEAYKGVKPSRILVSETVYGRKHPGFDPIWVLVPSQAAIIFIQEGSGCNLDENDEKEGYVDYVDYEAFEFSYGSVDPSDGGMVMAKEMIRDKYGCLTDAIPDVLDICFDDPYLEAQVLDVQM